ncbi:MAG: leucyl aminopeptidase [Pseudomonadota bacterium]
MQYSLKIASPESARSQCLVIGVYANKRLTPAGQTVDEASGGAIKKVLRQGDFDGSRGETLFLYDLPDITAKRVLLVGLGDKKKLTAVHFGSVNAAAAKALQKGTATEALSYLHEAEVVDRDEAWKASQSTAAVGHALYRFDAHKSEAKAPKKPLEKWHLGYTSRRGQKGLEAAIAQGAAMAEGTSLARDLGNHPGNTATPTFLAEQAKALGKKHRKIKVNVIDEKELEEMGAGAFVSVSKGSEEPGKLIAMEFMNGKKGQKPAVLVGKGVTFDTGGISLKPGAGMDEMKFDMCGAASVFGTLKALAAMNAPINVVCLVAAAENMPDGRASKPGDIVTTLSGKTVEILNTDAEGRLVLCDTLTYAERFNPSVVIDIATLTGACLIALGKVPSGLMTQDDRLAGKIEAVGQEAGDRVWRLPLWDDYQSQLNSNFADMQNIGGREAGSITAACFLSRFTENYTWAHLDIAGTAWDSGAQKGATGRPVPLLTHYLLKHHTSKG